MKNLLFLFATILTLSCCDKDDKPTNPIDQLPPATQTGANTAGCLVNGKAFLPKGYSALGNLTCVFQDGLNFSLAIRENKNDAFRSLNVISYNQRLVVGEIYQLKEYDANSKFGEFTVINNDINEINYRTTSTIKGELKITNHNFDKAILSGTFWFDAINEAGEKIEVREGRFDMEY